MPDINNMDDTTKKAILGEILTDELHAIHEFMQAQRDVPTRLTQLEEDVREVKDDTKIIKAAVTDQSRQLQDHEHRITSLEQAA